MSILVNRVVNPQTKAVTQVVTLIDDTDNTRTRVILDGEDIAAIAAVFFAGVPTPVPLTVTPLQMRKAIRNAPGRATLLAKIAALTEEQMEEWEYATVIDQNNGAIKGLNLTPTQLNNLFRLAGTF